MPELISLVYRTSKFRVEVCYVLNIMERYLLFSPIVLHTKLPVKLFHTGTTQSIGKTTEQTKSTAPLHTQGAQSTSVKSLVSINGIT